MSETAFTPHNGALEAIAAERQRQIDSEGWTPEHDDEHRHGEMAGAAACYVLDGMGPLRMPGLFMMLWPWDTGWWKPSDRRRNLVKAAALIVAEIERLDRAALTKAGQ